MPQADITVQYLNINKKNPKYASIKSAEGEYYSCAPEQLKLFSIGEVCNISYQVNAKGYKDFLAKNNITSTKPIPIPQTRARANPADSEQIFTTALLKEFIVAQLVPLETTAIVTAVKAIRDAYRFTFGGLEKQRNDTDMNDEIGF